MHYPFSRLGERIFFGKSSIELDCDRRQSVFFDRILGRCYITGIFLLLQHLIVVCGVYCIQCDLPHHGHGGQVNSLCTTDFSVEKILFYWKEISTYCKCRTCRSFRYSFEVAKCISEDSHGLIFGVNIFLALLMQSLMTLIIVNTFTLDIRQQVRNLHVIYIVYCILYIYRIYCIFTLYIYWNINNNVEIFAPQFHIYGYYFVILSVIFIIVTIMQYRHDTIQRKVIIDTSFIVVKGIY